VNAYFSDNSGPKWEHPLSAFGPERAVHTRALKSVVGIKADKGRAVLDFCL
jgi:hypothetical protein